MAQPNYTPIQLYRTATASAAPLAGNLTDGELAINTADGKLFYKDSGGTVRTIADVNATAGYFLGTSAAGASVRLYEDTDNGTNYVALKAADSIASNVTWTLPATDGSNGQTLVTNGSGTLSWAAAGGSAATPTALGGVYGTMTAGGSSPYLTAIGYYAGNAGITGAGNSAFGWGAMYNSTTCTDNTSIGMQSLVNNTTGSNNTAVGKQALQANTTASYNTAVGYRALYSNTIATGNTAIGHQAGYTSNPTAAPSNVGGNTFLGAFSGYSATSAIDNTVVGGGTGYGLTSGSSNTLVGRIAGYNLTTGTFNTMVGPGDANGGSGYLITTGSKNSILGGYNGNQGGLDIRTANNYIVLSDGDGNPRQWWDSNGISRTKSAVGVYASGTLITTTFASGSVGLVLYVGSIPSLGYSYQFNQLIEPGIYEIAAFGGPEYGGVGPGWAVGYCLFSVDIDNVFTIISSNIKNSGDLGMSASFNAGAGYISWLSQNQGYQNYPRMMFRRLGFNY